jgi:flagellar biogenesis protein FliO
MRTGSAGRIQVDGLAAWLLTRMRRSSQAKPRLSVVERISLTSRQVLLLVEADGRRILVGTSQDGPPVFYPLEDLTTEREEVDTRSSLKARRAS